MARAPGFHPGYRGSIPRYGSYRHLMAKQTIKITVVTMTNRRSRRQSSRIAVVAQLAERDLPKVDVACSNHVYRSDLPQ